MFAKGVRDLEVYKAAFDVQQQIFKACLSGLHPKVLHVAISSFRGTVLHMSELRPVSRPQEPN